LAVEECKQRVRTAALSSDTKTELDGVCKLGFKTGAQEIGGIVRQVCDEIALLSPTHQLERARAINACEARK
jgi:hypothetical protein